jgi:hypothetical protein
MPSNPLLCSNNIINSIAQNAFEDLPPDYMTVFLIILGILIFIFILLIVVFILLVPMLKRQSRLNYPIKTKKVISKERILHSKREINPNTELDDESDDELDEEWQYKGENDVSEDDDQEEEEMDIKLKKKAVTHNSIEELPRAKPVSDSDRSKKDKITAVTPVRISSHNKSDSKQTNEEEKTKGKETENEE